MLVTKMSTHMTVFNNTVCFDMYMSQAECMEKEKLQPQHRDVIASDTDMCMM